MALYIRRFNSLVGFPDLPTYVVYRHVGTQVFITHMSTVIDRYIEIFLLHSETDPAKI